MLLKFENIYDFRIHPGFQTNEPLSNHGPRYLRKGIGTRIRRQDSSNRLWSCQHQLRLLPSKAGLQAVDHIRKAGILGWFEVGEMLIQLFKINSIFEIVEILKIDTFS